MEDPIYLIVLIIFATQCSVLKYVSKCVMDWGEYFCAYIKCLYFEYKLNRLEVSIDKFCHTKNGDVLKYV